MRFNDKKDIRIIPFSPITVEDNAEIRFQVFNDTSANEVAKVIVTLDTPDNVIYLDEATVFPNCHVLFKFKKQFTEGKHTLTFIVNGKIESVEIEVKKERQPKLNGGFLMLGPPNDRVQCDPFRAELKAFTDDDWTRYMDEMKKIGIDFVIVTVTVQRLVVGTDRAHYESKYYDKSDITAKDPIGAIMAAAEKNNQQVFLGLGHTYDSHLENNPEIMEELYNLYSKYSSFYGWYQSEEANFNYYAVEEFARHKVISDKRDELSPVMPLLISPFFICDEDRSKTTVNEQLLEYFENNDVDFEIIMPQDMVGQSVLSVKRASEIYARLGESCKKSGIHFWANCEAFNFAEEYRLYPRFLNGGFFGEDGYESQLKGVYPHVEKIGTFMLSGFFTPTNFKPCPGGEKAVEFYENYVNYLKENNLM